MIAIDTNVLARFYCDDPDDPEAIRQRPIAKRIINCKTAGGIHDPVVSGAIDCHRGRIGYTIGNRGERLLGWRISSDRTAGKVRHPQVSHGIDGNRRRPTHALGDGFGTDQRVVRAENENLVGVEIRNVQVPVAIERQSCRAIDGGKSGRADQSPEQESQ